MNIPIETLAHLVGSSPQFMLQLTDDQQKKLRRFIHKRVLNPEDADDILQLTYLEAWRNRERFSGQATLSTWMCGIAQNLVRNHFRRMYAKPVHCEFDESLWHGQEENNNLDWAFEINRRLEKTLTAIDHLPPEMRKTLYASLETDGSYQDTADVLDIPIGTVRSRLSRAREHLKRVTHNPSQP
ncbi:RNA polymerase sigma factor [Pseudomonas kitaguniensis]|uniref:RNA polymerase sigma factor n=1 Tax=Pseudomonas kitaguniensis TaxID=2607908 RepID=UPI003D040668